MSTCPFIIDDVGSLILEINIPISDIMVSEILDEKDDLVKKWCKFFNTEAKKYPSFSEKHKMLASAYFVMHSVQKENGKINNVILLTTFSLKKRLVFTILFDSIGHKERFLWMTKQKFGNVLLSNNY